VGFTLALAIASFGAGVTGPTVGHGQTATVALRFLGDQMTTTVDFRLHILDGDSSLQARLSQDLRGALGARKIYTDWDGRKYFLFPEPYAHVRVYHEDTYLAGSERLAELLSALQFFRGTGAA
jgi:hypothetical protein